MTSHMSLSHVMSHKINEIRQTFLLHLGHLWLVFFLLMYLPTEFHTIIQFNLTTDVHY